MEVVPTNTIERIFAITVLLFALVMFSSFISSITGAMTRLRVMNSERSTQLEYVRRYIADNKISLELGNRVSGFLRHYHYKHKARVKESDLVVFRMLPASLRVQVPLRSSCQD